MSIWQTARFEVDLTRPRVMGIVNVTPDSFSDGGRHDTTQAAIAHCERLLRDGADILDIGGESTRPGSLAVDLQEELARVLPVVRASVTLGVPISVDTSKPTVMREALELGADIINDVWALRHADAEQVIAAHPSAGVCLMHMHRDPQSMQVAPMEGDVLGPVRDFLQARSSALEDCGVHPNRIVWDPGVGFGKTVEQNFSLLARQAELLTGGRRLLVGWSRKGSLGAVTGLDVTQRSVPSAVAAVLAVERGASIVRVHDVRETVAALAIWTTTISQTGATARRSMEAGT